MRHRKSILIILVLALTLPTGCNNKAHIRAEDEVRIDHFAGTHYELGYQHGQILKNDIQTLYTKFLTNSVFPYLRREHPGIKEVFPYYTEDRFEENFGYWILREAAESIEASVPEPYGSVFSAEIDGLADGSGIDRVELLILNTLFDSLLSVLNIAALLSRIDGPRIKDVVISSDFDGNGIEDLLEDGFDNDGDGRTDEHGPLTQENVIDHYVAEDHAIMAEIPPTSSFIFTLWDPNGVDMDTTRVFINGELIVRGDDRWEDDWNPEAPGEENPYVELTIHAPVRGYPEGAALSVSIIAADMEWVEEPPPTQESVAREERITFTVQGYGEKNNVAALEDIPNKTIPPTTTNSKSVNLAVHGDRTEDGKMIVGRDFVLLNVNIAQDHARLLVHHAVDEETGEPLHSVATVGWSGIGASLTAMNDAGLTLCLSRAETLDDSVVQNILQMKLITSGFPIGFLVRHVLEHYETVDEATAFLEEAFRNGIEPVNGWTILMADAEKAVIAEISNFVTPFNPNRGKGFFTHYTAGDGLSSITPYDIRCSEHFIAHRNDLPQNFSIFPILTTFFPLFFQRNWSPAYFTSVDTFHYMADLMEKPEYGSFTPERMIDFLREESILHPKDSMHSAVFVPEDRTIHAAMGKRPAPDGRFFQFGEDDLFPALGR
ncbi:carcinine hydrolase/isopenicillin-N N-acyltransferase family protein [Thermodesulfobacteriota bacterium]